MVCVGVSVGIGVGVCVAVKVGIKVLVGVETISVESSTIGNETLTGTAQLFINNVDKRTTIKTIVFLIISILLLFLS